MTESNTVAIERIRAQLAERWPELFNAQKPVPLAIGIHAALHEAMPDFTADHIRRALISWCKRPRYLEALTAGADRLGLDGVQGAVTEEQVADAAQQLKTLKARFQEKHTAKIEAEKARQAKPKPVEAQKPKQSEPKRFQPKPPSKAAPPAKPENPAPAKPAGPVITVKKRRLVLPTEG
jgi:sRNA-binding protein